MKYAINTCFGGFGLSQKALEWLRDNRDWKVLSEYNGLYGLEVESALKEGFKLYLGKGATMLRLGPLFILKEESTLKFRSNPDIIAAIEVLGEKLASGNHADIEIVETDHPIGDLEIDEYDGIETLQSIPVRF